MKMSGPAAQMTYASGDRHDRQERVEPTLVPTTPEADRAGDDRHEDGKPRHLPAAERRRLARVERPPGIEDRSVQVQALERIEVVDPPEALGGVLLGQDAGPRSDPGKADDRRAADPQTDSPRQAR